MPDLDPDSISDRAATGTVAQFLLAFDGLLHVAASRRARILTEIGDHLADSVEALVAAGRGRGEAEAEAVRRIGTPEQVARRFRTDPVGLALRGARAFDRWWPEHPWIGTAVVGLTWLGMVPLFGARHTPVVLAEFILPWYLVWALMTRHIGRRSAAGLGHGWSVWAEAHRGLALLVAVAPFLPLVALLVTAPVVRGLSYRTVVPVVYLVCGGAVVAARPGRTQGWSARRPALRGDVFAAGWAVAIAFPVVLVAVHGFGWDQQQAVFFALCLVGLAAPARRWISAHPVPATAVRWLPVSIVIVLGDWPAAFVALMWTQHAAVVLAAFLASDGRRAETLRRGLTRSAPMLGGG